MPAKTQIITGENQTLENTFTQETKSLLLKNRGSQVIRIFLWEDTGYNSDPVFLESAKRILLPIETNKVSIEFTEKSTLEMVEIF